MKFLAKVAVILIVTFNLQTLTAQTQQADAEEQYSLNSGTIDSQFEYVFRKSGNFKGTNGQPYEAVKQAWLLKLKANVLDSLKTTYKDLANSEVTVANQVKEIDDLKASLFRLKRTSVTLMLVLLGVIVFIVGIFLCLVVTVHWVNNQETQILNQKEKLQDQIIHMEALKSHLSD